MRRRGWSLAAALVVACALPAAAAPDAASPLDPLRAAIDRQDDLGEKGQVDVLVSEARARAKDGTPEALYLLGRALGNAALLKKQAGRDDDALKLLDESQRCFEDAKESGIVVFAPAYLGLGRCARLRGDLDAARSHLEQALKLAPAFREAAVDLAQVLVEKGLVNEAQSVLYRQIELRPKDPEPHVVLGMIKLATKRIGEAEREFRLVVQADPQHPMGRKLLAGVLLAEQQYEEAAENLETYRRLRPKDDEGWRMLFLVRVRLKQRDEALRVLEALRRELPGTDAAVWAVSAADAYAKDPESFEDADRKSPTALARRLESSDPQVVAQALADMRQVAWPALPSAVYRLLAPAAAGPEVRRLSVELIADQHEPRTVTVLEILLFHPRERDPDLSVRRAAARAIAGLPTKGIVPILVKALDDPDPEIREAAVGGIAAMTGKYFRADLAKPTAEEAWPAERALYDKWWRTQASASLEKRDAAAEMTKLFEPIRKGRRRLAEYALPLLEDTDPKTWRAGYDLFRSLSGQDFGQPAPESEASERGRITEACRAWFAANGNAE